MPELRRTRRLLGIHALPGAGRWAAASLIDAIGTGLLAPLTVLYFTIHVGLPVRSVGLGLTIGGLAALGFAPVGGALVDRHGPKPVLIAYLALAALAYASYGLVRTWPELLVAVTAAEIAASASGTARKALLAEIATGEDRVTLMASQRSLRNLGYGVGGALASVALAVGGDAFTCVVEVDAVSFLVAIVLLSGLHVPARRPTSQPQAATAGLRQVSRDVRYLALSALDLLTSFYATALEVAIPLWVVLHTDAPRALAGALFTFNTVIVVFVQVRATSGVRQLADVPLAYLRAAAGIVVCAIACLTARDAGAVMASVLLVIGVGGLTASEMFASAGEWAISLGLADDRSRGSYLSVFSIGSSLQDALGPSIVTVLLTLGVLLLWPVLAALVCAGALMTVAIIRRCLRSPSAERVG